MSTKCFLLAFRRFLSRRGNCKVIYCDNARTFKASQRELAYFTNILKDKAEIIVNNRPLTYVENDPGEPEPLTPAHFLELGYGDSKIPCTFYRTDCLYDRQRVVQKKKDFRNSSFETTLETLEGTLFTPVKNS
ncbi:hypothetical protein AVEN_181934-1 [Araneus ventricosus]|uniref:Integrase catalytic domain-containing protein n=1 Tax=Araneus ventricosus TaxID=182803 RepID=A0A4Y2SUS0_ARAVE|nr:hypothetical protein AVEN_181934-1 [Araneus ventricosus]